MLQIGLTTMVSVRGQRGATMRIEAIAWFDVPNNGKWHGQSVMPQQELIRCRECKYWMADYNHICTAASGYTIKSGDGFCDWAERREDDRKDRKSVV